MGLKPVLGVVDYLAVLLSLLVPVFIGIRFRLSGGTQKSTKEYLLANNNAPMLPVIMSTTVTVISAISMVGSPAETYRFGPQFSMVVVTLTIGMILASKVFLPVYFRCKISSIYEFLEMRFGKITRYAIAAMFIFQMVLFMSAVLFAPVMALSAVTHFSTEMAILICGAVGTFYCFTGGLKAVLWSDLFQSGLMYLTLIIIYAVGINEIGGFGELYRRSAAGNRLQFFDTRFDFATRYTLWNTLARGICWGMAIHGTSQIEVQRSLSMSSCKRAQTALQWSSLTSAILFAMCSLTGLVMYAVFYSCDPILHQEVTGLKKYDQLVPYFVITRLMAFPGLSGLCIAGIFSASLSTISSALNSVVTVLIVDFIKPSFPNKFSSTSLVYLAKGLTIVFGIIFIGNTFVISGVDSILQVNVTFLALTEGPVFAIFLIGVLTRKTSDKSAAIGLVIGTIFICWIGFGSLFSGYRSPTLPLKTSGCPAFTNATSRFVSNSSTLCPDLKKCSSLIPPEANSEVFSLFKMPFNWISLVGTVSTICAVLIVSLLIDRNRNVIPANSKCLSPVVRYWMQNTPQVEETKPKDIKVSSKMNGI